jgi:predicted nucleic acid-binding Zn ribbon protein
MRRRARQLKPETLGDILQKVLKKRNIPHTPKDRHLVDLWRRAVGQRIAAQTYPESQKRGVLFVRVSAAVWLHQLQFLKEEILGKLSELKGKEEIRSLFFSIGEIPAPPPGGSDLGQTDSGPVPLSGRDRRTMKESLHAVQDPELREIIERVMAKEIGRRRLAEKRQGSGK